MSFYNLKISVYILTEVNRLQMGISLNGIKLGILSFVAFIFLYSLNLVSQPDSEKITKEDIDAIFSNRLHFVKGKAFSRSLAENLLARLSGENNIQRDIRPEEIVDNNFSASSLFKQFNNSTFGIAWLVITHNGKQSSKTPEKTRKRDSTSYEQLLVIRNQEGNFFLYPIADKETLEYWINLKENVPEHKDSPKGLESARENWGKNKALTLSDLEKTFVQDANKLNDQLCKEDFEDAKETYSNLFGTPPRYLILESIHHEFFSPKFEFYIKKMKYLRTAQPFAPSLNPTEWPPPS